MSNVLHHQSFQTAVTKTVGLKYLEYFPADYEADSGKRWPLLLFLHGGGERGSDLDLLKLYGIPLLLEQGTQLPFIVLSPQCPGEYRWSDQIDELNLLLEEAVSRYAVDVQRIYLTGLSQGGCGSWHLAMLYPHWFAAMAPICGFRPYTYGYPEKLRAVRDIPVWTFHGALDEVISIQETLLLTRALHELGGNVRLTIYPEASHSRCWEEAYSTPELYEWLLSHTRHEPTLEQA